MTACLPAVQEALSTLPAQAREPSLDEHAVVVRMQRGRADGARGPG